MKRFHQFCLTLALLLAAIPSMAAVTVRGTVTDETGQPVVGAGVVEVGTTNGVVTGTDGKYVITVKGASSVLQFSCIGYETVEETVGNRAVIDVVLQEAVSFLQEAVAIGYGTQKKADITSLLR